jgi:hypothetical protein
MEIVLGVIGTETYNLSTHKFDYSAKIVIQKAVYNWLLKHDIKIDADGSRIFVCNKVEYKDLGLYIK